jgi:hypothetical protein
MKSYRPVYAINGVLPALHGAAHTLAFFVQWSG